MMVGVLVMRNKHICCFNVKHNPNLYRIEYIDRCMNILNGMRFNEELKNIFFRRIGVQLNANLVRPLCNKRIA